MKCFFVLSGDDNDYYQMVRVLVKSAFKNTDVDLYCVYDGSSEEFVRWLEIAGVTVLRWRVSFLEELVLCYNGDRSIEFCRGTYICMEIPRILEFYSFRDEHILYVDADVMFTGPVELDDCKPRYFASSSDWKIDDWSRFSTGVIVMNRVNLLDRYPAFLHHLRVHNFNFSHTGMGPCDQGAWNTFYTAGEHDKLESVYDWKPWWGINDAANIVHFSGPKPKKVEYYLQAGKPLNQKEQLDKFVVNESSDAYEYYVKMWRSYL